RYLLLWSFAFDGSVAGVFWTLARGATLVLPEPRLAEDPARLARTIAARSISHVATIPSLYALVLEQHASELAGLSVAVVAAEPCPRALVERHARALPGVALVNEYGPIEA